MPELAQLVKGLAPDLRQELATRWSKAALDEHASVASFSRFSLHLQVVGAPPELLEGAHQAALDEIKHARLCFGIASVYAGEGLAPGPLDLRGDLLGPLELAPIAAAAVIEGCVGETVAALEASTAAEEAGPEAVRDALTVIAADEGRHAQLAWTFVGWALQRGDGAVRDAVTRAFAQQLDVKMGPAPARHPLHEQLAEHGKLDALARYAVRLQARDEVLRPTVRALLNR